MKTILLSALIFCFSFTSNSQILNGGMETYSFTAFDTIPTNWTVRSPYGSIVGQTNDAHSGNYAFAINTWYYYGYDMMVNGYIEQGDFLFNWMKGGTPVSGKPTALKGFYKYTETLVTDSAMAKVLLKKWNTTLNKFDTISFGETRLAPTNTYTNFEIALTDYSVGVQPDSIVIYFVSHDPKNFGIPPNGNARFLYIDDLSLTQPVGIMESKKDNSVSVYYANNDLNIINNQGKIFSTSIYSIDGKLLLEKEINTTRAIIPVSEYNKGVYIIKIKGEVNLQQKFFKD